MLVGLCLKGIKRILDGDRVLWKDNDVGTVLETGEIVKDGAGFLDARLHVLKGSPSEGLASGLNGSVVAAWTGPFCLANRDSEYRAL